ncbi:MAG: hypothetical protein M3X11_02920 [Acidobacteriota bacterium]|nr:hypothetical protein [Acidobacteriota bacterium]
MSFERSQEGPPIEFLDPVSSLLASSPDCDGDATGTLLSINDGGSKMVGEDARCMSDESNLADDGSSCDGAMAAAGIITLFATAPSNRFPHDSQKCE